MSRPQFVVSALLILFALAAVPPVQDTLAAWQSWLTLIQGPGGYLIGGIAVGALVALLYTWVRRARSRPDLPETRRLLEGVGAKCDRILKAYTGDERALRERLASYGAETAAGRRARELYEQARNDRIRFEKDVIDPLKKLTNELEASV